MKQTPLFALHRELGAKMVPFAGYDMPVQYPSGILQEHLHTRAEASVFDVSHMGQLEISGAQAQQELESLLPLDLARLARGQQAYSFLPNEAGGVIDDVIIARQPDDSFLLIANSGCKDKVIAHLDQHLVSSKVILHDDSALLALQGPRSCDAMRTLFGKAVAELKFMTMATFTCDGLVCRVSRSGYTGEDGFEIALPATQADPFARRMLQQPAIKPAGLGARDSLRLEAGLCLYGHELGQTISPIAAGIGWTISKTRREGHQRGGFPAAEKILTELSQGAATKRVGLVVQSRVPVREGAVLRNAQGNEVGKVTSGTFSPSLGVPIAMGSVASHLAKVDTRLHTDVRGKPVELAVTKLPFVPHRYVH